MKIKNALITLGIFLAVASAQAQSINALVDIAVTPENSHIPGGGFAPAGSQVIGSVSDCGAGRCYGNQAFFANIQRAGNGSGAIVDIQVSGPGAHIPGGPACANGYERIASFADCGGGNCYGNQVMCVRRARLNLDRTPVLSDIYLSPENWHRDGHQCPRNYRHVGTITDCGSGQCFGNQLVCVK